MNHQKVRVPYASPQGSGERAVLRDTEPVADLLAVRDWQRQSNDTQVRAASEYLPDARVEHDVLDIFYAPQAVQPDDVKRKLLGKRALVQRLRRSAVLPGELAREPAREPFTLARPITPSPCSWLDMVDDREICDGPFPSGIAATRSASPASYAAWQTCVCIASNAAKPKKSDGSPVAVWSC